MFTLTLTIFTCTPCQNDPWVGPPGCPIGLCSIMTLELIAFSFLSVLTSLDPDTFVLLLCLRSGIRSPPNRVSGTKNTFQHLNNKWSQACSQQVWGFQRTVQTTWMKRCLQRSRLVLTDWGAQAGTAAARTDRTGSGSPDPVLTRFTFWMWELMRMKGPWLIEAANPKQLRSLILCNNRDLKN